MKTSLHLSVTAIGVPMLTLLAATVRAEDYTYTINNGTITITRYTGSASAVTIPNEINGLPVTSVGAGAFYENTNLTSLIFGTNVSSIGEHAFSLCYSLAVSAGSKMG